MATRDPLSVLFDPAARRLLERAYANRGSWTGVFVAQPTVRQRAYAASLGIFDLRERDRWGEPRWVRAFKRSTYWNLRYYGRSDRIDFSERRAAAGYNSPFAVSLIWDTGQLILRKGWPSRRWAVRVMLEDGGSAARAAVERGRSPEPRWVGTSRQSGLADRDWE